MNLLRAERSCMLLPLVLSLPMQGSTSLVPRGSIQSPRLCFFENTSNWVFRLQGLDLSASRMEQHSTAQHSSHGRALSPCCVQGRTGMRLSTSFSLHGHCRVWPWFHDHYWAWLWFHVLFSVWPWLHGLCWACLWLCYDMLSRVLNRENMNPGII